MRDELVNVSLNDLLKKVMYSKLKLTSNAVFKR